MILDMTEYHNNLKRYLKERVKSMKFVPTLHIITDGKDKRCETYMKSKLNMCKEIGVPCVVDVVSSTYEISELLDNIENTKGVCICQLPINKKLEEFYKIDAEFRDIDVDGVFSGNNLMSNSYTILPATAKGIMQYIQFNYGQELRGKNIVLVGMGDLCNKPLLTLFAHQGATIMTFNTSTSKEVKEFMLKNADIVICAGGKKGTVKTSQLSDTKRVLVFNVGIVFDVNGKLDTELEIDIEKNNIDYTPRIKGVGVSTVLSLIDNVLNSGKDLDIENEKLFKELGIDDEILDFSCSLRKEILNNKSDYAKKVNESNKYKAGFLSALDEIIFNFGNKEYDNKYKGCDDIED